MMLIYFIERISFGPVVMNWGFLEHWKSTAPVRGII